MTDVLTTHVVVIFRVKVTGIMSVDGIKLWLLNWLINYVMMLLVLCQLSHGVIGYEDLKCHWCISIRLLPQFNSCLLLVIFSLLVLLESVNKLFVQCKYGLLKCQSLSTTVLHRTTFTQTTMLNYNPLMKRYKVVSVGHSCWVLIVLVGCDIFVCL